MGGGGEGEAGEGAAWEHRQQEDRSPRAQDSTIPQKDECKGVRECGEAQS